MEVKVTIRNIGTVTEDVDVTIKGPPRAVELLHKSVKEVAKELGAGWEVI